jgi:glucose/arabinose dehydrogenase
MRPNRESLTRAVASAALLLLAACTANDPIPPEPTVTDAPELTRTVVLGSLENPWDIAFAPDGAMFFTERCVGLSVRRPNGSTARLFGGPGSALVAPDFFCLGQTGMHGVAVDPDFANNRRIYVFMASNLVTNPRTSRVVRLTLDAGYTTATERTDIITDIHFKDVANGAGWAGAHSGGRIRFGPDGYLYVGTGDNHSGPLPQSPTLLGGKVLRVTTSGAAAPGNNAPAGFDARIYSYGHRNVQGISFHPTDGTVVIAEHGPNHSDEVTPLVAGGNGGWDPQDRAGLTCPDGYCGYAGNPTTMPMTDRTRFPTAVLPLWNNGGASQGLGPIIFLVGAQWRAWNGRMLVGIMGGARLAMLVSPDGVSGYEAVDVPTMPPSRYRALTQGPDGSLYVATDDGEIWRVTPSIAAGVRE